MMEYKILTANVFIELTNKVNMHIQEGWKPQGGVAIVSAQFESYYQAMIRETNKEEDHNIGIS